MTTPSNQSLSHLQWRAPEFLSFHSPSLLSTPQLALEYFSLSPFFDRSSTNNQLTMQLQFSQGTTAIAGIDFEKELKRFVGIEFKVDLEGSKPPRLWIVEKRYRSSPEQSTLLNVYHILNENVYQAPTLYTILNERILTSLDSLNESLQSILDFKPKFNPESISSGGGVGYQWDIKPQTTTKVGEEMKESSSLKELELRQQGEEAEVEVEGEEDGTRLQKRTKVEGGGNKEEEEEEEMVERPSEQFNPLLFRALQKVAREK